MYAWCQLTQWDGPDYDGPGWGVGLLWLTPSLCLQVHYSCKLGVESRELRRCLCIKEFNVERSAQFRDDERVDSSTGTAERLDAVKRGRSRCRCAESTAARRAAKCECEQRRRSCKTVEQTAARRASDRSRSNRHRSAETPQQTET